jgi:hypothetical protein
LAAQTRRPMPRYQRRAASSPGFVVAVLLLFGKLLFS